MPSRVAVATPDEPDEPDEPSWSQERFDASIAEIRALNEQTGQVLGSVSRWANAMLEAIEERNRAIRAAVADGHSQRAVARAAGLTHPAIAKIVARADQPGDQPGDSAADR